MIAPLDRAGRGANRIQETELGDHVDDRREQNLSDGKRCLINMLPLAAIEKPARSWPFAIKIRYYLVRESIAP